MNTLNTVACISILGMMVASPLAVAQGTTFDEDGLTFEGENTTFQIGGRLHLDTVSVSDDITPIPSKSDVRRFRLYATLEMGDDWKAKVDADVGGLSPGFKNVWISYKGFENTTIKLGNFIAPLSGENMMSSNNIKLMERSLGASLAPNFLTGIGATYRGDNWSLTGGYFTDPLDADALRPTDEGQSLVGRLVLAPIKERRRALHFAAAIENRQIDDGLPSLVSTRPELGLSGVSLLSTSALPGVSSFTNYNFEAGYMQGPVVFKGQYITRSNDAPTLGDPTYNASSIEAAWVLTGERQRYGLSSGTFGQIRPRGKYGAFEVAARYSTLDLNDGLVTGGEEQNWTVGANWYVTRNMRLMLNYVSAETKPGRNLQNETVDAVMARLQIAY